MKHPFIYICLVILSLCTFVSPMNFELNCRDTKPSTTRPTSVHKLKPGDIDVVGAIGDSITAGFAMKSTTILNVFMEWRGLSFSVGGESSLERGTSTIPNILKKFNPNLYGYSMGTGLFGFPPAEKNFNVARTGADAGLALPMAEELVSKMKTRMGSFYNIHWKLVTIFLGNNDHCDHCYFNGTMNGFVEEYKERMVEALDYLHKNMPRGLVQIVGLVNPTTFFLHPKVAEHPVCRTIHDYTCECIADGELRTESLESHRKINIALQDLAASGKYDTRDDFTLVYQPTLGSADLPKKSNSDDYDLSFMGHDCFHPSYKLHSIFGFELWNSMLTPVKKKTAVINIIPREEYILNCPSWQYPYIATNKNSFN